MSNPVEKDEFWMGQALELARQAWGQTHPNPMVGAVLVENGECVSSGYHAAAGEVHAERMAIERLGRKPGPDARLFITMEPCSTQGRTPPCTQAILDSGIKEVVLGCVDPNPRHSEKGIEILRRAGIKVVSGVLSRECEDLNLIFHHRMRTGLPLVAGKSAVTLDGKTASRFGHSQWITGPKARAEVMRWRRYFPAIAVGSGTVLRDDPQLTSRVEGDEWCPERIVFDRDLKTVREPMPRIYTDSHSERTTVLTACSEKDKPARSLIDCGVRVQFVDSAFDLRSYLIEEGLDGLLVEGGQGLLSHLYTRKWIDYHFVFIAPRFLGDAEGLSVMDLGVVPRMDDGLKLEDVRHDFFPPDTLVRGRVVYPERGSGTP